MSNIEFMLEKYILLNIYSQSVLIDNFIKKSSNIGAMVEKIYC